MKKFILMLALFSAVVNGANAQTATENSNALDNVSVGVTAGLTTPLDLNSMFPLNTLVGLRVNKGVTPIFGVQLEALGVLNDNHFGDIHTAFNALNINGNLVTNLSNAFGGYKGTPRIFEINAVTGLGWLHACGPVENNFVAKTGFDLAFNIGKKKAHSIVVTPAIMWNLTHPGNFQFSNAHSQFGISISYVYHFKNSNGTHSFKTYDIGEINRELAYLKGANDQLKADLDECLNREPKVIEKLVLQPVKAESVVETVEKAVQNEWVIQFSQGGATLTKEAKSILNTIGEDSIVEVVGTASPEGNPEANKKLSEKRAAVVADYLTKRGVKVSSWEGKGVQIGEATNRLAIVTLVQ